MSEACKSYPCRWPANDPAAQIAEIAALSVRNGLHTNLRWSDVGIIIANVVEEHLNGGIRTGRLRAHWQNICCHLRHELSSNDLWPVAARLTRINLSISDLVMELKREPQRHDTALALQRAYIELRHSMYRSLAEPACLNLNTPDRLSHLMIDAFCEELVRTILGLRIFAC